MAVLHMACSGVPHRIAMPTWEQLQAAIARYDGSIWLEAEHKRYLSVMCSTLAQLGLDLRASHEDGRAWRVFDDDWESDKSAVMRYEDADFVPTPIAIAAIRDWFDRNSSEHYVPAQWTGPARWAS